MISPLFCSHPRLGIIVLLIIRCVFDTSPETLLLQHGKSLMENPSLISLEDAQLSMLQW